MVIPPKRSDVDESFFAKPKIALLIICTSLECCFSLLCLVSGEAKTKNQFFKPLYFHTPLTHHSGRYGGDQGQCDQIGQFTGLWATF